ncbi:transposase [Microcystis aeruginosa CS-338/01]|uniref:RNA-guided endonuclease InsQ/TnpB family protein n=1 Tax=Microcystis aeruginosa TaxID=1126 RepID=UPI00232EDB88|nr:transposase [Microcystis aeruginosa]MDB9507252.1 transposase [Microcystis aeruginosa CS-338/01]
MITLTYQYKLKVNRQQEREIVHILDVCKSVYNYALSERKDWLNSRKCLADRCSLVSEYIIPADEPYPNYFVQAKNLTEAKKVYPILKTVNAQVLQQVLKTLDKAFDQMKSKGFGFPRFKKKMRSFVFPALSKNFLGDGCLNFPQLGKIRIRKSRKYPSGFEPKQARIIQKASGFYVSVSFQSTELVPDMTFGKTCLGIDSTELVPDMTFGKTCLGIDAGIESFVATSRGDLIKAPRFLLKVQSKLKLLQRRLKRKTKGSSNWLKLQEKIARLHEKVSNTRRDWHFKLAHYLCDLADNIFVEDINFVSWSRGIVRKQSLDSGIGSFINEILPFVIWKRGKYYLKVDKNGTSQECPNCGAITGKKALSERVHRCDSCGHIEPRDTASAEVIENRGKNAVGLTVLENARGGDLTGIDRLNQVDLVKSLRTENPPLHRASG